MELITSSDCVAPFQYNLRDYTLTFTIFRDGSTYAGWWALCISKPDNKTIRPGIRIDADELSALVVAYDAKKRIEELDPTADWNEAIVDMWFTLLADYGRSYADVQRARDWDGAWTKWVNITTANVIFKVDKDDGIQSS